MNPTIETHRKIMAKAEKRSKDQAKKTLRTMDKRIATEFKLHQSKKGK